MLDGQRGLTPPRDRRAFGRASALRIMDESVGTREGMSHGELATQPGGGAEDWPPHQAMIPPARRGGGHAGARCSTSRGRMRVALDFATQIADKVTTPGDESHRGRWLGALTQCPALSLVQPGGCQQGHQLKHDVLGGYSRPGSRFRTVAPGASADPGRTRLSGCANRAAGACSLG
jgi:hypothetical protein